MIEANADSYTTRTFDVRPLVATLTAKLTTNLLTIEVSHAGGREDAETVTVRLRTGQSK